MMNRHFRTAFGVVFTAVLVLLSAPALRGAEPGLMTDCTVLVGYAENGGPHGDVVLIVPGTLIPALEGNQWPSNMSSLEQQLKDAYRLQKMRAVSQFSKLMTTDAPAKLPPADGIETMLTLVGFNDTVATYRAEMSMDGQALASASLSVSIGGRAVMGSRLANAAHDDPYVFIVVQATSPKTREEDLKKDDGSTRPRAIEKVNPRYPEEARKQQLSGQVVLEAMVNLDGTCTVVNVLETPDEILSAAAIEALEQWRWEPGLDPSGKPVKTTITLTIKFALK
jgi:TonB family protein